MTNVELPQGKPVHIPFFDNFIFELAAVCIILGVIMLACIILLKYLKQRFESFSIGESVEYAIRVIGIGLLITGVNIYTILKFS